METTEEINSTEERDGRHRSGRHRLSESERKKVVSFYIRGGEIEAMGGIDELQRRVQEFVREKLKEIGYGKED